MPLESSLVEAHSEREGGLGQIAQPPVASMGEPYSAVAADGTQPWGHKQAALLASA